MKASKSDYTIALFLIALTFCICAIKNISGTLHQSDDSAYLAQTIALANGTTAQYIIDNTFIITHCDWIFGPYAYPWGYPMLLLPFYKIFGLHIYALKFVNILCYALFVGIFYIFCANRLWRIYAIFATLFFALNPYMTYFAANAILCDISFLLFGFIALIVLSKLFESPYKNPYAIAILGGIFMLFATMIRINGLCIVCALIAMHGILMLKRFAPKIFKLKILKPLYAIDSPYSWKIHAIPYVIFVLGFALVSIMLSSGGSGHWSYLSLISIESILYNFYTYIARFEQFFELNNSAFVIFSIILLPFLALGIRECLKRNLSANVFYIIFICGFFVVLLLWIETAGLRFVFLLLPFLVFWTAMGISKIKSFIATPPIAVILLIMLGSFVYLNMLDCKFLDKDGRTSDVSIIKYTQETAQMWDFIKINTPKDSLIISIMPRAIYLYTNRLGFSTNKLARLDEVDYMLWRWSNDYNTRHIPNVFSQEFQKKTELIYQNAEYKLFKVVK